MQKSFSGRMTLLCERGSLIDLRVKRTLKRSTVAAAFVAVFFLISELAGLMLSNMLGNLLGILATAGLMFFLAPIQRIAERLSDAAMPKTRSTPEYASYRKLQVYEAALRATLEERVVQAGRRPLLDGLVDSLGIDPAAARQLEQDLTSGESKLSSNGTRP